MTLIKILAGSLLVYLVYAGLLFAFQRHILFPRYQIPLPASPPKPDARFEPIWLHTGFGKVEAWFLPAKPRAQTGPAPILIFAHGNAELIDFWPEELKRFTSLGIGVLLVEYPGYGRSDGRPSQKTITETFVAAYDRIIERTEADASRVILMGRSLGGGAVCALGTKRPSAAVILVSSFTSVKAFANRFLLPGALIRDPFDNLAFVRTCKAPVLVVHGKHDDLIPFHHGLKLFRTAEFGRICAYECGHNDCPPDWDQFMRDVTSFLAEAGLIEGTGSENKSLT